MEDEGWLKKCLIMGLITLIPIVGAFNLIGWMKAYTHNRLNGRKELPEPGLDYIGSGFWAFLSGLPLAGLIIAIFIVFAILGAIARATGVTAIMYVVSILGVLVYIPLMLWLLVVGPAMMYVHTVHDEKWASIRFARIWAAIKGGGTTYLLLWVVLIIAGFIGGLGAIACGVGMLVSMPYAQAMYGAAYAEYAKATNRAG